jgi:AcrR family transcriptional regulator
MPARPTPLEPKQARSQTTRRRLLDAAVDELVDRGYVNLTTSSVAHRAGVSRGAQQHHVPHKATLVTEAVHHLADRQLEQLRTVSGDGTEPHRRVQTALDLIFAQYSGPLFAAMLTLSLTARDDAEVAASVTAAERKISKALVGSAPEICGPDISALPGFDVRWPLALSTVRGIALLRLLGHPKSSVDRQWRSARPLLVADLLDEPARR